MTTIITRTGKGSSLTWGEADANFTNLNTDKLDKSNNLSDLTNALLARTNLGIGNVDNTSDADKPVSTAQQTAIDSAITTHVAQSDPHTQYLHESVAAASSGSSLIGYTRGVTGATTRTVESVLYETISVKDFGAVGDGVTDDSAAFNLAIAYANSKGGYDRANIVGTTIYIPTGRYKLNSGLSAITVSHVVFHGESRDSAVLLINTTSGLFHYGGGVTVGTIIIGGGINNLKIEYLVTPLSTSYVVYADYAYSLQIYDLVIVQIGTLIKCGRDITYSSGEIYLYNVNGTIANAGVPLIDLRYGSGFFMSNCHIFVYGVTLPALPTTPLTTVAGTHVVTTANGLLWDTAQFTQCIFERFDRGVFGYAQSTATYVTFRFTNVIFDFHAREAVYLDSGGGGSVSNFLFDSNCWYCSWSEAAIKISAGSGYCDKLYFSGDCGWSGKEAITYYNPGAKECMFTGMKISGVNKVGGTNAAMYFQAGSKGFYVSNIIGNHVANFPFANTRATYGLVIGADCDNFQVTGCSFEGSTLGWSIAANSLASANRLITGNIHADYATSAAAVVPATSTLYQNKTPFIEEYNFYGGTATVYNKNGLQIGTAGPCSFTLQPQEYYYITYTVAPTGLKTIQR